MVSPSSSATPPCAPAATPGPSLPVPGMPHAEDAWYSWLNSPDGTAIQVMMRVYEKTLTKREVSLNTLDPQFISCHIQGEELPRLNGRLFAPVKNFDVQWTLETEKDKQLGLDFRFLTITLPKVGEGEEWPMLFQKPSCSEGNFDYDVDLDAQALYEHATMMHASSSSFSTVVVDMITKSAERGCIPAQLKLAAWYELGCEHSPDYPVAKDTSKSHHWHAQAADSGSGEAAYIVGTAHLQGTHGCTQNYAEAAKWFVKCITSPVLARSVPQIYVSASFQLGLLHMEGGKGLGDPNPAEAARFWKNSAALGHADSIFNLGIFFLNGFGMDQDIVGGIRMIQLARNANPSLAMPPPLDVLTEFEVQVLVEHMIAAKSNNASADDKNTTIRDENVDNQKFLMFNIILAKRMAAEKLAANGQGPSSATPSSDLAKGAKKSLSTSTPSSSSSSSSKKKKKKSSSKKNKQESEKLSSAEEGSLLANLDGGIVVAAGILVAAVSIGFYAWLRK